MHYFTSSSIYLLPFHPFQSLIFYREIQRTLIQLTKNYGIHRVRLCVLKNEIHSESDHFEHFGPFLNIRSSISYVSDVQKFSTHLKAIIDI